MDKEIIPDVLADRYATPEMVAIWSPRGKIVAERRLWIAVMRAQQLLGVSIPPGVIEAYEHVIEVVDLAAIEVRERVTRHDVKARLETFNALAGHQWAHVGMTSRDLTDNVEQMQIRTALTLIRDRLVAVLAFLADRALHLSPLALTGRSHNAPAQVTTLGKRLANAGEELLQAFYRIEEFLARYPLRGMKGPVGTAADQLELLGGDGEALRRLEGHVAGFLGFDNRLGCVGQIYPRSLDYEVVSVLAQAAAGPSNLATTFRLMAGFDLLTEGFQEGQVGSSAMPHKMNTRTCERVNGFNDVIHGFGDMISRLCGRQWQEGDVSCSVVRRVAIPGAFLAMDGLIESFLTILIEFGPYPAVITSELDRYFPFLTTTRLLRAGVARGIGREVAHATIKEHAVALALDMREQAQVSDGLYARLAAAGRLGLSEAEIRDLVGDPQDFTGDASNQVAGFARRIDPIAKRYPAAATYTPYPIL